LKKGGLPDFDVEGGKVEIDFFPFPKQVMLP
jgi:hypothetical protein